MNHPVIPPGDLELLRQYDTPTVCNVVELFDLRPAAAGYMDGSIQACFPRLPPMVGYASTATFRSAAPPRTGNVYAGLAEQVASFAELPGPAVVVFQDLDNPVAAATFGEVMCTTYKAFGAAGLITSGAGRDLDQVEPPAISLLHRRHHCAHGYCHFRQLNVPVHVGGVTISSRRSAARRPQWRDDDPARDRLGGRPRLRGVHGRRGGGARLPRRRAGRAEGLRRRPATNAATASRRWHAS